MQGIQGNTNNNPAQGSQNAQQSGENQPVVEPVVGLRPYRAASARAWRVMFAGAGGAAAGAAVMRHIINQGFLRTDPEINAGLTTTAAALGAICAAANQVANDLGDEEDHME